MRNAAPAVRRVTRVTYAGQSTCGGSADNTEEDPIKEIHDVWALSVCISTEQMVHEIGKDNLSMIMDSSKLRPAQVRLRSATGVDTEVMESIVVRRKCDEQAVAITALFID